MYQAQASSSPLSADDRWPPWRQWRFGLGIAAASFVFFVLGAVLRREAGVVSFGDATLQP